MNNKVHATLLLLLFYNIINGQQSYIRSTLPNQDGIVINPDNGRPFNELATEFYDNGQTKLKGRYSGGFASGYWTYFYQNGEMKARGRYYKAQDNKITGMIEGLAWTEREIIDMEDRYKDF